MHNFWLFCLYVLVFNSYTCYERNLADALCFCIATVLGTAMFLILLT